MEAIINYLLGVDGGDYPSFNIYVAGHNIDIMRESGGAYDVWCKPAHNSGDPVMSVTFTDKLEALSHIQNFVKEITTS